MMGALTLEGECPSQSRPALTWERAQTMSTERESVTRLLQEWSAGDKGALDELMPVVYDQMHRLAAKCLRAERPDHTLRATALVNEAYMRLVSADVEWQSRVHFFAVAARMLRRILVDHAKANDREKRGGGAEKIEFDEAVMIGPQSGAGILELDLALQRLSAHDAEKLRSLSFSVSEGSPMTRRLLR